MKQYFKVVVAVAFLCIPSFLKAQVVTNHPKVEEASAPYVTITRVEITDQHTAIFFRFIDNSTKNSTPQFRFPFPGRGGNMQQSNSRIWIDPNARLYKPGDVNTKFRFLRAEGIPTNPSQREVNEGEVVEFVTYFEPLPAGLDIFDFYEGRSSGNAVAWNFYGIHINNPSKRPEPKKEVIPPPQEPTGPSIPTPAPAPIVIQNEFIAMSGKIIDATTNTLIKGNIKYVEEGDSLQITTTSGKIRLTLTPKKGYTFIVSSPGYADLKWESANDASTNFEQEFRLTPIKSGTTFTLERIFFTTSEYTLLKESHAQLDEFVEMLQANPNIKIRVEGHSDNLGDFDKNVELSKNRANAVKEYLVSKGINSNRIEIQGFGPTKPISKGTSEEERQKNRRVEIRIIQS